MDISVWIAVAVVAVGWSWVVWRDGHRIGYHEGFDAGKAWGREPQRQTPGGRD